MRGLLLPQLSLMVFFLLGFTATPTVAQTVTLQDLEKTMEALPEIVIYQAKEIVTLDPEKPTAQAVAVVGDRILATGSLDELKAAAGKQPYAVNTTFANKVIVPGFIAQHDHPWLTAPTMTSEIIAIEDWVLPDGARKAAKNRSEYLKRLADANAKLKDPNEVLLTWGYHQYFHACTQESRPRRNQHDAADHRLAPFYS